MPIYYSLFLSVTNIVPQNSENNSGFWNRLEWFCRGLAKRYDAVYVFTGPLFIAQSNLNCAKNCVKRNLSIEVIGKSGVYVPTHLYKAILVEKNGKPLAVAAFVVPNAPIPPGTKISDYQVSKICTTFLYIKGLKSKVKQPSTKVRAFGGWYNLYRKICYCNFPHNSMSTICPSYTISTFS